MKSISPEEFFKNISIHSGITDLQSIKDVYYGMIKTISRELKGKQVVFLPEWGEFALKIHKGRRLFNVNDKSIISIPAKATVKFKPDRAVKRYFHDFGSSGTMIK